MIIDRTHQYKQNNREWFQRKANTVKVITVHHTADTYEGSDDNVLQREANVHINQGWPGLSYHFFITRRGNIYKINNFEDVTWHDAVNWDSIGVALMGYFHPPYNEYPTSEQLSSLRWLLEELTTRTPAIPADATTVYGHRERSSTACPGDKFIQDVMDYRNKKGLVSWGKVEPAPETPEEQFLGKPKAYWLQVEKDREDLMKQVGSIKKDTINKIISYVNTL